MADLNDLNKPDGGANFQSEVWPTLRGHLIRLWAGDYTGMSNLVAGMRRWVSLGGGNVRLVQRDAGGTEVTIFDSSSKADAAATASALADKADASATAAALATKAPVNNPTFTGGVKETRVDMGPSNAVDCNSGTVFVKSLGSNTTLTVTGVPASGTVCSFILEVIPNGYTLALWSNIAWPSGIPLSLPTTGRHLVGFMTHNGGAQWNGILLGKDMA